MLCVGVLVHVLQISLVHVRVAVGFAVVGVFVSMLDVRMSMPGVGMDMRVTVVGVLVGVGTLVRVFLAHLGLLL